MADMPASFWNGWILVITLVSLAAMVWLVLSLYFSRRQGGHGKGDGDGEPVWDGTLREGANAPPMWWFWLILGSTAFSLVYLMLYPGLGFQPGMLDWQQGSRVAHSYGEYQARFQAARADIAAMPLLDIQNDPRLMALAERVFERECSACHGHGARGQVNMFPNLRDSDWQWGGTAADIEQSIRFGRTGAMVPWEGVLSESEISAVVSYVSALGNDGQTASPGKTVFDAYCAGCHAADGSGNTLLGAPDLRDNVWLYGGDREALTATVTGGRQGVMPAFGERLDDTQLRLLVALLARSP